MHPANTVRVLLNRSPDLPGQLWVNWFIVAAAKWPGKEKGEKTEQAANHDLAALLAVPLLFAQCHPQPLTNRLKCQRQRILRLVIEEATAALADRHHHSSVIFQRLRDCFALVPGVDQVLCKTIYIDAALIYSLFHIISIRYAVSENLFFLVFLVTKPPKIQEKRKSYHNDMQHPRQPFSQNKQWVV